MPEWIGRTCAQGWRFFGRIAVDSAYSGLALDDAEGERIARSMMSSNANKDVAFLANHGVIVTGQVIAHAYDDLYDLERACKHQVLAESTGRALRPVDPNLAAHAGNQIRGRLRLRREPWRAARPGLPGATGHAREVSLAWQPRHRRRQRPIGVYELGVTEVGCMAHAWRKFHDLRASHQSPVDEAALNFFDVLYDFGGGRSSHSTRGPTRAITQDL